MDNNNNSPFILFTFKTTAKGSGFDSCSSAISDHFGISPSDVITNANNFFDILPEPEKSQLQQRFTETAEQDTADPLINIEFSYKRFNGEKHRYLLQAQCSHNPVGTYWSGAIFFC
jgi:PAS domain-containing protein